MFGFKDYYVKIILTILRVLIEWWRQFQRLSTLPPRQNLEKVIKNTEEQLLIILKASKAGGCMIELILQNTTPRIFVIISSIRTNIDSRDLSNFLI